MDRSANNPPVVMQVVPELGPGGAETACLDIAAGLTQAGAKAIIVSHGGIRLREVPRTGALHIDLPVDSKNPLTMARNVLRLRGLIRKHKVDIVHARSRAPAWSCLEACRGTNAHFMTTCHAPFNINGAPKRFYNSSIARGEKVIAISHYVAEYLEKNHGIRPPTVRVIQRGLDLTKFHPASVMPERIIKLAREWRVPDGVPVVMMPARLTRWKGHEVLIDAMAKLGRKDVFCVMLGSAQGREEYLAELEARIQAKGLEGQVRIVDHCTDMPAAYRIANVVVSASTDPEGFGRVAAEAQAMGRPCIATDHGGSRETILRGQTGWLVPPGNADILAQAIGEALAMDPVSQANLGAYAMAHIAQHFSKQRMVADTLGVYDELLGRSFFARSQYEMAAA